MIVGFLVSIKRRFSFWIFSKNELARLLMILFCIFLLWAVQFWVSTWQTDRNLPDFPHIDLYAQDTAKVQKQNNIITKPVVSKKYKHKKQVDSIDFFVFNPNDIDQEGFRKLGFSLQDFKRLEKIRAKKPIQSKADFKKLFFLDDSTYNKIMHYIALDTQPVKKYQNKEIRIELNTAQENDLMDIPKLGYNLATSIVAYRQRLGGYTDMAQLKEVYGIKDSTFHYLLHYLTLDTHINRQKIDINTADYKTWTAHPYIDYKVAKSILAIRFQKQHFKDIAEIKESKLIGDSLFIKLKPYLTLNDE
jgi:DNA uptake protein ComE-like DNA-binding protein